jgi:hypothetical protein
MRIRIADRGPRSNADPTGSESETLDQDIKFVCEGQTPFYRSEYNFVLPIRILNYGKAGHKFESKKIHIHNPLVGGHTGKAYSTPKNWTV